MANIKNYFDYAAATPLFADVRLTMEPFLTDYFYNSSALYSGARTNREALKNARHLIAEGLGARPTEVVFTAGGSEANNLAIKGILDNFPKANLVVSSIEHESVLEPAKLYDNKLARVNKFGIINLESLQKAINDKTVLISIMYANNEVGAIQLMREVSSIVKKIRLDRKRRDVKLPLYFHTDACQAANYLDMQVSRLGVDLLTLNAGKIYGPKQCGALYVKKGVSLKPLILGGGQEWNLRSGTENLANIVGFAAAWQKIRVDYRDEAYRLSKLRDSFFKFINDQIPSAVINGPKGSGRLPNNIHLTFPGQDNERLLMWLDERGFQVATGSACSASSDEPSHVLKAMGLSDEAARSSLRITLGRYTTEKSLQDLGKALLKAVAKN